jgi:hypothetical protein
MNSFWILKCTGKVWESTHACVVKYIRAWLPSQAPRGGLASQTRTYMGTFTEGIDEWLPAVLTWTPNEEEFLASRYNYFNRWDKTPVHIGIEHGLPDFLSHRTTSVYGGLVRGPKVGKVIVSGTRDRLKPLCNFTLYTVDNLQTWRRDA